MRVSECRHPTMLGTTCGDCGVTIEEDDDQDDDTKAKKPHTNTVSMLHTMPGLKVSIAVSKALLSPYIL